MIAGQVSANNQSKVQVRKTLNALVWLSKANYSDTAAAELRQWRFQKEKYSNSREKGRREGSSRNCLLCYVRYPPPPERKAGGYSSISILWKKPFATV
jgi:hypothetical protein